MWRADQVVESAVRKVSWLRQSRAGVGGHMRDRPHCDAIVELYRADPDYVFELLSYVERNGDAAELSLLLSHIEKAFGGDAFSSIVEKYRLRL